MIWMRLSLSSLPVHDSYDPRTLPSDMMCMGCIGTRQKYKNSLYFWDFGALRKRKDLTASLERLRAEEQQQQAAANGGSERTSTPAESLASADRSDTTSLIGGGGVDLPGRSGSATPRSLHARGKRGKKGKGSRREPREKDVERFRIDDPYEPLQPHVVVTGVNPIHTDESFTYRASAWSVGGEWCVAVDDRGGVALFGRERTREI
jgi:hypothetical protein